MDPGDSRDPRFNLRSRYDVPFTPRSHQLPPPRPPPPTTSVAPSNYYSHPQFHPPPLPPPQFHHHLEDSRRYLNYPDVQHRDSRVYGWDGTGHRETRVFNERMTPDAAHFDWGEERNRVGIRKDGFFEEEFRVRVRKNEYLGGNNESTRSRVREYGNTVDDYRRLNWREQEKSDYFRNIGEKVRDDFGAGYFGNERRPTVESGWNPPLKLEQKTSALGRIQSGESVWNRIKENAESLQDSEEQNVSMKLNSKKRFMPKKMKRAFDREQTFIQVSSKVPNDYAFNNPTSSEVKTKETVSSGATCNGSKMNVIGSSSMPVNTGSLVEAGSSGTSLSNDSKANTIDLPSMVKNNGLKRKADDASSKQPTSLIMKTNASAAEVSGGFKKANVSSSKPMTKGVVKNSIAAKKAGVVSTKVGSQAITVSESKPNSIMLVSAEKDVNDKVTKQSNKDGDCIISSHVSVDVEISADEREVSLEVMEVNEGKPTNIMLKSTGKSDVDRVEPQPDKDIISIHESIDATPIPIHNVIEDSSKNANTEHRDNTILLVQSPSCGPTLYGRSLIETSVLETKSTEQSSLDADLVKDNDAGDNLKELMKFSDKVAHNSDGPDAKIIIDVSSDSSSSSYSSTSSACSSDQSSFTESPCQDAFPVEVNDDLYNKDIDVVSTGSSLNTSSASKLVDDSHVVDQGSHIDDTVNKLGNGIEDNHSLVAPSIEGDLEEDDKSRYEDKYDLPIDVCTIGDDEMSPINFRGNENPSAPIAFPGNEGTGTQIMEDGSVDVTVQERSKQPILIGSAKEKTADIPKVCDVLNYVTNQKNENGSSKEDSVKNGDFVCSERVSKNVTETSTKKKQTALNTGLTESAKPIPNSRIPKVFPNQLSSASSLKSNSYSARNPGNKTWHRTNNPVSVSPVIQNYQMKVGVNKHPTKKQSPKKVMKGFNSSYFRKGNSLIRKPTNSVAHHPILPFGVGERKIKCAVQKDSHDTQKESLDTKKESLDIQTECSAPILAPILENPTFESKTEAVKLPSSMDIENTIKSELLNRKKMVYVKNKSNQLVAASAEKNEKPSFSSLASDIYYMRNRNKLIRNASSSENQPKQNDVSDICNSKYNHQPFLGDADIKSETCPLKRGLEKVQRKIHKHGRFSRVWMPSRQSDNKIMPSIFPWKRTTYRRNLMSKHPLNPSRRSLSSISRKLQNTRKRDTIYTLSNDGFSLRKSRVVSVGGPNLKWSKSIDKDSKKANEEATLAVAEAEREKRERKRNRSRNVRKKKNNKTQGSHPVIELQPGERVFRFGSIRYKMDASQHTLVRIDDEQSSDSVDQHSKLAAVVPRRLLIGNNEYIRKGNGNQLVRDPKKLVRMLASEKIRWSIHTARKRLAKKQQYCQFFTRFGKCNKISGKCPYIHDPDKIAICTKFLRGSCTNAACKLTHKIIPERMPDCSYYLQGLCTNLNCPYRHVHVNPQASVCDGFLKGFCAEGDECRKKHSYICPTFEATGDCPEGSKCKLHHPKSTGKSKKRRLSKTQNTTMASRYFGFNATGGSENMSTVSSAKCHTEDFADFISLDCDSDADDGEDVYGKDYGAKKLDSDVDDLSDEVDSLIKPIRIMKNDR